VRLLRKSRLSGSSTTVRDRRDRQKEEAPIRRTAPVLRGWAIAPIDEEAGHRREHSGLGFLDWVPTYQVLASNRKSLDQMVDITFAGKDKATFKLVICLAQGFVLRQKFGVQRVNAGLPEEAHV